MDVITREFYNVSRTDEFKIVPLFDIHCGVKPCRENLLKARVKEIAENGWYWIGGGDYCDFVNRSDPRYSPHILADWFTVSMTADIAGAQVAHLNEILKPIAPQCLGLLMGNHETAIHKHYERFIFSDIITNIKEAGKFDGDEKLAMGYSGWLLLKFHHSKIGERRAGTETVLFALHHGFTGGRLAGAKALAMQRFLWQKECDIGLMGHSHNTEAQIEQVEYVDRAGNFAVKKRHGAFCGTFLDTTLPGIETYSAVKGYPPMPVGGVEVKLMPRSANEHKRIKLSTW